MIAVLARVFKRPYYLALATTLFLMLFSVILLLPNIPLIVKVAQLPNTTWGEVLVLAWNLMGSITTNFGILGAFYAVAVSLLFAINLSLVAYYLRYMQGGKRSNAVVESSMGMVAGLLGIGCASCGSIIVASLLSIVGLGGMLSVLPFGGAEFGILGIALLLLSTILILKRLQRPLVC